MTTTTAMAIITIQTTSRTTPERAQESLDVLHAELERVHTPDGSVTQDEFDRAVIGIDLER